MESIFQAREQLEETWRISELCIARNIGRNRLVSSMLFVALNHADAIQVLAQQRNFASAYALIRPLFETTFRAIWLFRCATEDQVEKLKATDDWKSAWELVLEIEEHKGQAPILSRMWSDMRLLMHSFTHGGFQNAYRQLGENNVVSPNLPDEEVFQLMQKVGLFSWVILGELIDLSEKEELLSMFEVLGNKLNRWAFNQRL